MTLERAKQILEIYTNPVEMTVHELELYKQAIAIVAGSFVVLV